MKLTDEEKFARRMERCGYTEYPLPPKPGGGIDEHLPVIVRLIGTALYEYQSQFGQVWIRPIQD